MSTFDFAAFLEQHPDACRRCSTPTQLHCHLRGRCPFEKEKAA